MKYLKNRKKLGKYAKKPPLHLFNLGSNVCLWISNHDFLPTKISRSHHYQQTPLGSGNKPTLSYIGCRGPLGRLCFDGRIPDDLLREFVPSGDENGPPAFPALGAALCRAAGFALKVASGTVPVHAVADVQARGDVHPAGVELRVFVLHLPGMLAARLFRVGPAGLKGLHLRDATTEASRHDSKTTAKTVANVTPQKGS